MMIKIPEMTMRERALGYPYEAPTGSFLISGGYCQPLPESYDFADRVGVLSVGSNRAPAQLYRKFGKNAEIPVTAVNIHGCDIVHVANLAPYGAVPCSAFPSEGVVTPLNIAWLNREQLVIMHETESLGVAYEFVEWDCHYVEHLHPKALDRLFGYASLKGALGFDQQGPLALEAIKSQNRQLKSCNQQQALFHVFTCHQSEIDEFEDWLERCQQDSQFRQQVAESMARTAITASNPLWRTVSPEIDWLFS